MFGQQIIFEIGGQLYSLDGLRVVSVEATIRMENLAGAPKCIKGVTVFRDDLVPICDLYKRFGLNTSGPATSQIVFVRTAFGTIGCEVDIVREITTVDLDSKIEMPFIAMNSKTEFLSSVIRHKNELVTILDPDKLLNDTEAVTLKNALKGLVEEREAARVEAARLAKAKAEAEKKMAEEQAAREQKAKEQVEKEVAKEQKAKEKAEKEAAKAAEDKPAAEKKPRKTAKKDE